jgi:hypothetical protein
MAPVLQLIRRTVEMWVLCMVANKGRNVIFCMPNRTKGILLCMQGVRRELYDHLVRIHPQRDWSFIVDQIGMFSYTGLTPPQVRWGERGPLCCAVSIGCLRCNQRPRRRRCNGKTQCPVLRSQHGVSA